jgi:hypothetical protein
VLVGDWICASCIADENKCPQLIEAKSADGNGHVVYRVRHWGAEERAWLRPRDLPSWGSRNLVKRFNEAQREHETKTKGDAEARGGSRSGRRV